MKIIITNELINFFTIVQVCRQNIIYNKQRENGEKSLLLSPLIMSKKVS